jgi:hypothetical protein
MVDKKVDFFYFAKYEINTKLKFISRNFADRVLLVFFVVVVRFDLILHTIAYLIWTVKITSCQILLISIILKFDTYPNLTAKIKFELIIITEPVIIG